VESIHLLRNRSRLMGFCFIGSVALIHVAHDGARCWCFGQLVRCCDEALPVVVERSIESALSFIVHKFLNTSCAATFR
jgi:hypothetical protein